MQRLNQSIWVNFAGNSSAEPVRLAEVARRLPGRDTERPVVARDGLVEPFTGGEP